MIPFSAYFVPRHREGGTKRGDQAAAKPDFEYLYDKVYEDRGIVRIASPFTVESLAPHRTFGVDEIDALIDHLAESKAGYDGQQDGSGPVSSLTFGGMHPNILPVLSCQQGLFLTASC